MKIQFNLKTNFPSRACEVTHTFTVWAREGVSERRWRSAANRPSRQARPGGVDIPNPTHDERASLDIGSLTQQWGFTKGVTPPLE